ncbi:hypothetical protein J1N35_038008 [Gossypium stocksii]|uniref:Uncharacterized protein n=1 Tax=Gossypium stocksii TaxID=47602 RepID=A0A9D3ZM85_9ROSI|nr:hypothetical protein J1N35_038008 [Gossypium stocksii]
MNETNCYSHNVLFLYLHLHACHCYCWRRLKFYRLSAIEEPQIPASIRSQLSPKKHRAKKVGWFCFAVQARAAVILTDLLEKHPLERVLLAENAMYNVNHIFMAAHKISFEASLLGSCSFLLQFCPTNCFQMRLFRDTASEILKWHLNLLSLVVE